MKTATIIPRLSRRYRRQQSGHRGNGIHYHHPQLIGIEGYRKQLRKQNTCALWGLKLYRFPRKIADSRIVSRMISGLTWEKIPADSVKRDCCWNVKQNCMSTRRSALRRYRNGGKRNSCIPHCITYRSGKSRIVEEDIQKFAAGKEQFRALILAPNTNIIADWKERIDKDLQPLQDRIDIKTYSYAVRHYHEKQGIIIPIL